MKNSGLLDLIAEKVADRLAGHVRDESVLTDAEAGRMLGLSASTIRRMKLDGRLNCVRTPRGLAVRVCDVERYARPRACVDSCVDDAGLK
ncbi:MAG TPA: hypothetical protein PLX39_15355 [Pyrinomonadaceae bacterium]|nr:hypothetical protein [Pyrinomonadaceae bacterium]